MGCGYDFEIRTTQKKSVFVEVKGLAKADGGILFTDKEWRRAKRYGKSYYLVLIANVDEEPTLNIIRDPASQMDPKRTIYTSIQVSWGVPKGALQKLFKRC